MDAPLTRSALPGGYFAIPVGVFLALAMVGVPGLWNAAVGLLGCLMLSLGRSGIEFRADRTTYRKYVELFGQRAGKWQPLRPVVGITLKYFSELTSSVSGHDNWGSWTSGPQENEELVLMLSLENSSTSLILSRYPLDAVNSIIDAAHELAGFFGDVPVHQFLPPSQFQPL